METQRTTSGITWNEMHGLLAQLKKNGKQRDYLLIATGCYLGLRASDLLKLKWVDVIGKTELILILPIIFYLPGFKYVSNSLYNLCITIKMKKAYILL